MQTSKPTGISPKSIDSDLRKSKDKYSDGPENYLFLTT